MRPTAQRRPILDPPLIAGLVALLVLAVVTFSVALRDDDAANAGGSGSTGTTAVPVDDEQTPSAGSAANPSTSASASESTEATESTLTEDDLPSEDGTFTFKVPAGYADGVGQIDVPSAIASAYDEAGSSFPTTIVVTTESVQGYSLQELADAVADQAELSFSTTSGPSELPLDSVDGEPMLAITTGDYAKGADTITSTMVFTEHGGTAYAFIVNALADQKSTGETKLVEFVNSVHWT